MLAGMLVSGSYAFAQQAANPFVSKIEPPIPVVINATGDIHVSVIDGLVNGKSAFSLVFENTTDAAITFSWSLVKNDGNTVGETHITSLAAHSKLDYSNGKNLLFPVVFVLSDGEKYTDYKVEIKY